MNILHLYDNMKMITILVLVEVCPVYHDGCVAVLPLARNVMGLILRNSLTRHQEPFT